MVSCNLNGGLGNQMFQIAAAYALSLKNNDEFFIDITKCNTPNQGNQSIKYKDTIYKKINKKTNVNCENIFYESNFQFSEIKYEKNICIDGYFQSEKYFEGFENEIKDLFHVEDSGFFNNFNKVRPTTSIHVRRGDYLKNPLYHPVCNMEYYKKAIKIIGDSDYFIFSDDIEWCRENFNWMDFTFINNEDDIINFNMMSECDNNIISNSTFSWWSAYLNKNKNKIIISPLIWFGPNGPNNTQDLIPERWIKI